VATDLVAVHFATPAIGWACGHDGVVLRTDDGGLHWRKQLDGRALEALLRAAYAPRAAAGDASAKQMLDEIGRDYENGTQQPLLGLWFADERDGFAVGSFGILLATHDGGATWQPWMDRIDNPELLHLFAIGEASGAVVITSEKGTVFRLDAAAQRFVAQRTGYAGSLFGLVAERDALVVFGLRGTALRTRDGGASWQKLDTGTATGLNGGAALASGGVLLASQGGQLLAGDDPAQRLRVVPGVNAMPLAAVAVAGRTAVVAGLGGVQAVRLP
jgi:photosystem II stability/assembly factor-like uncharacterized protein